MMKLFECVPNFSVGRDDDVISRIAEAASRAEGTQLHDIHSDCDHNRSVFTVTGGPDEISEAAFLMAEAAVGSIDLNAHFGAHPRVGACDVIPFAPVSCATLSECVEIAKKTGERIGYELGVPVFLYEAAASRPERRNLADLRRGGLDGLSKKMAGSGWEPDYGPIVPHKTAGVVAVGARKPLIAFNILLDTPDVGLAKKIAAKIRESSGGLPCVKALGLYLAAQDKAQVSMNLTDYETTPIHAVYEAVEAEAKKRGVGIHSSELVGLAPAKALAECAGFFIKARGIASKTIEGNVLDVRRID